MQQSRMSSVCKKKGCMFGEHSTIDLCGLADIDWIFGKDCFFCSW